MAGTNRYHYFVEGTCEQKLLTVLKEQKNLIVPGTIDVFNVTQKKITDLKIRTLPYNIIAILVFDTDNPNVDMLNANLAKLKRSAQVKEIWCVLQVPNLEGELQRSTDLKDIKKLFGCEGREEFKEKFIKERNLYKKLLDAGFILEKMWSMDGDGDYGKIKNDGYRIKN